MSETLATSENKDFDTIEEAVLASPKGRWFLQEFARRNRAADTNRLLDAIEKLYEHATKTRETAQLETIFKELSNTRASLIETRSTIAALREASPDIDDPAQLSARAALDVASAAQSLQEIAEEVRRAGIEADLCDEMDVHIAGIFMAGSYQEMTVKRVAALSDGLAEFENRLSAILDLWVDNN